jgi:hypothetical protein
MKYASMIIMVICFALLLSSCERAISQEEKEQTANAEVKAEVPALTEFHSVIYKIWHTAWPNKDYAMLQELLPDVEKLAGNVAKAELPGILRDKKTVWDENIKKLQEIVVEYKTATEAKNNENLMQAAERLHSQYEKLVRTIRPVMKEIASFHESLYPLYHYYLPNYEIEKIKTSVAELKEKMDILNKAELPERWKEKEKKFTAARKKLSKSVDDLAKVVQTNDKKKIKNSINKMHSQYQVLEKVFD